MKLFSNDLLASPYSKSRPLDNSFSVKVEDTEADTSLTKRDRALEVGKKSKWYSMAHLSEPRKHRMDIKAGGPAPPPLRPRCRAYSPESTERRTGAPFLSGSHRCPDCLFQFGRASPFRYHLAHPKHARKLLLGIIHSCPDHDRDVLEGRG